MSRDASLPRAAVEGSILFSSLTALIPTWVPAALPVLAARGAASARSDFRVVHGFRHNPGKAAKQHLRGSIGTREKAVLLSCLYWGVLEGGEKIY